MIEESLKYISTSIFSNNNPIIAINRDIKL
ncbi:hypothetical protein NYA28ABAC_02464 [Salinicola sp. NYA28a]